MKMKIFQRMSSARQNMFALIVYRKLRAAGVDTSKVYLDNGYSFTAGRLGLYCGTGWDKCMVSHELAHIIQPNAMDFCRMYLSSKGSVCFKIPEKFLFGRMIVEPETNKITLRELDTFALEYVLCQKIKLRTGSLDNFMKEHIALTRFLPDYYFWTSDEEKAFAETYFKERVAHWSKVDIIKRLNTRLKYIQHVADLKERHSWYFKYDAAQDKLERQEVASAVY